MTDDEVLAAAAREAAMKTTGLVVLLERVGGRATYTEAEYNAIVERYGGTRNLTIHVEVVRTGSAAPEVQLTLTRKAPGQAELVS